MDGDYSFPWTNGRPGCGKVVLSSTIIQRTLRHRRSSPRVGIAFRYFTSSDPSKQNVSGLLRAPLLQLSNQLDDGNAALTHLGNTFTDSESPVPALESTLKTVVAKSQDV